MAWMIFFYFKLNSHKYDTQVRQDFHHSIFSKLAQASALFLQDA
jgi:hypothetical protein